MSATLTLPLDWTQACASALAHLQEPWAPSRPETATESLPWSDAECMRRYRRGDAQAFRVLYTRYRDKLHRYALRLAGRASEADEIFQDVWMAVVHGKDRYEPQASFAAWLFGIAHRRAADRWRVLGRHAPDAIDACGDEEALEHHAGSTLHAPDRLLHNDALGRALIDAVQALPLPQREAFLMKAEGELSLEDIALATGTTRETVKSRLRYAQQKLRDALEAWR
ncbi:RNA polymerase, sigma subunit, ECF family [Dyella jiangningensis]|uniref:sigma-70 family RNA polymerase sigma factor n=1 Tax=Dyella sp. AtDHG13 TaxID=1938897 RepID=UPI00087E470D|nr:sigma-70 family RNA polymerase sigma factor [Dyella sp. AtDHG13]PXV55352.1 RNA polymerase ECF family sigma subunit [Dyella sp. AtDHG13]SDK79647.1 RNA polymerase, sigma subunit, ECF family [Dyella jiangningensis]